MTTCPTCEAELEPLVCGPAGRTYRVLYCPTCNARIEDTPTTTTSSTTEYPRSSADRADTEDER